jgi:hypothetical protein
MAGLGLVAAGVVAAPAGAAVTGGCTGQAVIEGTTYGPENDTPDNAIVVPEGDAVASWSGQVPFDNANFSGTAGITVGPTVVQLADWSGVNEEGAADAEGEYSLADLKAALPVDVGIAGIYEVIVEHQADGGSCRANVFVRFEGDPLSTPLGIVSVAGAVLTALGMFAGMFAKPRELA